ncbi:MAG: hypothetical protein QM791_01780 [Ferruginibacter sp.]
MKIGIHSREGSYTEKWIEYCDINAVPYKLVDCYHSGIINELEDCDALMWHWNQNDYKAALFARQLTCALELLGKKVFPDYNTCWHHNDKLGQKYLFEAAGAPLANVHVFYTKKEAEKWLDETSFPKIFKLRGGAASVNVWQVNNRKEAQRILNRAFGRGIDSFNNRGRLRDKLWVLKRDKNLHSLKSVFTDIARFFIKTELAKFSPREKGYVYFQDFLPGNEFDTRLAVIGNRCFGVRRYIRTNDFRASGSGVRAYEPGLFDHRCIRIAFDLAEKLKLQSAAFDFMWDGDEPRLIEVSYCSPVGAFYEDCPGYWDNELYWHSEKVAPQKFMIEDFLGSLHEEKNVSITGS